MCLNLLEELPDRFSAPGLMPSLSTVAPHGRDDFFDRLIEVKNAHYPQGRFQLQFSIHTTDLEKRDQLIPVRKWDFTQIAAFGARYYRPGDRKLTLNFALAEEATLDAEVLKKYFDPDVFLIKITPLNPTYQARKMGLTSYIDCQKDHANSSLLDEIRKKGFRVILSIGEREENEIGSNCGQYVQKHLQSLGRLGDGYSYQVSEQNWISPSEE